ncbi:SNF2 family N-terminal domain-domain-containing protein [Rutstroemia sp. NJR-2017a WRK4]|nr:SNF2 family N-terminal domain-domain-containing protein [Rutstroemia sp. NJR-2017a WRK4]
MGLGKTLSMICLIAANQAHLPTSSLFNSMLPTVIKTTLLIVPPACTYETRNCCCYLTNLGTVIQAWKKQFDLHLRPGKLTYCIYHGQNRKDIESLGRYDVVITTYHTISAIWRKLDRRPENEKSIFSLAWHRVILDEAHIIQNPQSQLSQACYALRATRRWAITGTPIQNKLADFASIVKFLRIQPRMLLEEAISSGNQVGKTFNALRLLNTLRLICNHGLLAQSTVTNPTFRTPNLQRGWSPSDTSFYGNTLDGAMYCLNCGANLLEAILEGSESSSLDIQRQTAAGDQMICELCISQTSDNRIGQSPMDYLGILNSGRNSAPAIPATPARHATPAEDYDIAFTIESMSTKIKALVADLSKHNTTEKSVVFSYWTTTLDLIQLMLNHTGITHTRIDGKTSLPKRSEALQAFQHNDSIRVILVSITCGGAGLDLTAGSRVYLLEPHWNPMIEEQALCRVHRVGQQREVTTIRYLMRDSFEEVSPLSHELLDSKKLMVSLVFLILRTYMLFYFFLRFSSRLLDLNTGQILTLQARKKTLAQVTLSRDPLASTGIDIGTLQYLRSVLE